MGYAGLDWLVNDRLLLGMMSELDWTDDRANNSNGEIKGTGWMVGPYLSAEPAQNLFFDLRVLWGKSSNSAIQDVLGSSYDGNFDTERWLVQATLAGSYQAGAFELAPDMSMIYMSEQQKDYDVNDRAKSVAVDGQTVELGRVSTGMKISYLAPFEMIALQPFVRARLFWDFENPGLMNAVGSISRQNAIGAELSTGLSVTSDKSQLALEATYDGFGSGGLEALTAKLMFTSAF